MRYTEEMAKIRCVLMIVWITMGEPAAAQMFTQSSRPYDESLARKLMAMSAGAYAVSPDECIWRTYGDTWKRKTKGDKPCDLIGDICSFYIAVSDADQRIIVVFRGTRGPAQLFSEAIRSIGPGEDFYGFGKVNNYFLRGLNVLWEKIYNVLSDEKRKEYHVAFTGHSLGGAMAALAAFRTILDSLRSGDNVILYTFGEPRVGNAEFAMNFNRLVPTSFRIVHGQDIVPHLPPCLSGFMTNRPCGPGDKEKPFHHGVEVWYPNTMNSGSNYRICSGAPFGEDYSCSDGIKHDIFKTNVYMDEHRFYFGHKVPAFGKFGCASEIGDPREINLLNNAKTSDNMTDGSSEKEFPDLRGFSSEVGSFVGSVAGRRGDTSNAGQPSSVPPGSIIDSVKNFGKFLGIGK